MPSPVKLSRRQPYIQRVKIDRANQLFKAAVAQVRALEFAVSASLLCSLMIVLIPFDDKVLAEHVWVPLWEDSSLEKKELGEKNMEPDVKGEPE